MSIEYIRKTLLLLLIVLLAAAVAWLGRDVLFSQQGTKTLPASLQGVILPQPKVLPEFQLSDQDGQPFTQSRLLGKWTFLFFGYTHCPDICPTTLFTLQQVHKQLATDPAALADTQFLFVSLDPHRDTLAILRDYIHYFDASFLAATGDTRVIDRLTTDLGVPYAIEDGPTPDEYVVNHSATILLLDPQGRYYARFSTITSAAAMTADYRQLRTYYTSQ